MAKLGLQLYTVRDELEKDYLGTIRKAAEMGYEGVEFPGGLMEAASADDVKKVLDDTGLVTAGAVFMLDEIEKDFMRILDYCRKIGCTTIVFPWIVDEYRTAAGYTDITGRLNSAGKKLKEHGIKLLYHIHGYEFDMFDGKSGIDIMMKESDAEHFNLEIDVYWVEWAGMDSVEFMEKYGDRSPSIHSKDMKDRVGKHDVEVGDGALDMLKIAQIGNKYNAEWFIVEQEEYDRPTLESAAISFKNLKKIMQSL